MKKIVLSIFLVLVLLSVSVFGTGSDGWSAIPSWYDPNRACAYSETHLLPELTTVQSPPFDEGDTITFKVKVINIGENPAIHTVAKLVGIPSDWTTSEPTEGYWQQILHGEGGGYHNYGYQEVNVVKGVTDAKIWVEAKSCNTTYATVSDKIPVPIFFITILITGLVMIGVYFKFNE